MAELEKESAEQQQHIQTLHNQLAEEKGKLEKKGYYRNGKASRNVNDRIRRKYNDSTSIAEQIEKLTVQLQKVEAENKPYKRHPTRSDCETAHGGAKRMSFKIVYNKK